jgi:hypothetical protein
VIDAPAKLSHGHGFLHRIVHLGEQDALGEKEVQ